MKHKMIKSALLLAGAALISPLAIAQTPHGIAAVVNDDIVTTYDLQQRVLFMVATTGVERDEKSIARVQQQAMRNLVDEHIQMQESEKYDQTVDPAEVDQSVGRLISRNGLDPNEVIGRLAEAGITIDTLRDQVRSEIAWQRIVNGLYGSRIRISDAQIDETLNRLTANASKPSFRVAEIYIEATPDIGGMDGALEGAKAMINQVAEGAPFPLLAQQFSSASSAAKGGDVGWVREGELRPELDAAILTLEKGGISDPIQVPGGVYVVALLDTETSESETFYKLKQINIPADTPEAIGAAMTQLVAYKDKFKSCDTLAEDAEAIEGLSYADMGEVKAGDVNETILGALAGTDVGALSEPIETSGGAVSIMVCARDVRGSNVPTRDDVENRLMDQQLASASKRHLRDLRRNATISVR